MLIRLGASFALAAAVAPASASPVLDTTLCAVVRNPAAYNGKVIRIRAGVFTDWQHGTLLVHSGCKRGINLTSTDAAPRFQSQALDRAIGTPMDGGYDRTAMATFIGRFSWKAGYRQGAFDYSLGFAAHRIEQIKVYPRQQSG